VEKKEDAPENQVRGSGSGAQEEHLQKKEPEVNGRLERSDES